jgi:hypothetical protein
MSKLSRLLAAVALLSTAALLVPGVQATPVAPNVAPQGDRVGAAAGPTATVEQAAFKCAHRRVCRPGRGCAWRKVCKQW